MALSGSNQELAQYVMSYAAKLPQKSEIPSQMTIFDLNGGMDVVDFTEEGGEEEEEEEEDMSAYDEVTPKKKSKQKTTGE